MKKINYKNIMCAAPYSENSILTRSNAQHFSLMKKSNEENKIWYHRVVLNKQNVQCRVLSKKERADIYKLSKRKRKPFINYFD